MQTETKVEKFFSYNPTLLSCFGKFKLWEHPTRGDSAPIYMSTPSGRLINTGFYDLEDFDLDTCKEIAGE